MSDVTTEAVDVIRDLITAQRLSAEGGMRITAHLAWAWHRQRRTRPSASLTVRTAAGSPSRAPHSAHAGRGLETTANTTDGAGVGPGAAQLAEFGDGAADAADAFAEQAGHVPAGGDPATAPELSVIAATVPAMTVELIPATPAAERAEHGEHGELPVSVVT